VPFSAVHSLHRSLSADICSSTRPSVVPTRLERALRLTTECRWSDRSRPASPSVSHHFIRTRLFYGFTLQVARSTLLLLLLLLFACYQVWWQRRMTRIRSESTTTVNRTATKFGSQLTPIDDDDFMFTLSDCRERTTTHF
jgi:hypothetical protein